MRDWNKNGKRDAFDRYMDYKAYEMITKSKKEEELSYQTYEKMNQSDYKATAQTNVKTEDLFGLEEISHKSPEEILKHLIEKQKELVQIYESVSVESGFREVFDNRQMGKDFWIYSFGVLLETSSLKINQKKQLMQLLMEIFLERYPYTAQKHYDNLSNNMRYRNYLEKCFGVGNDGVRFWILLGAMSGNDGERSEKTLTFTNEYMKFMAQLEVYLNIVFSGRGFGQKIHEYLIKMLELTADRTQEDLVSIFSDMSVLKNPLV